MLILKLFLTISSITLCYLVLAGSGYPLEQASYRDPESAVIQQQERSRKSKQSAAVHVRNRNEEYFFDGPSGSSSSTLTLFTLLATLIGVPCCLCYASKSKTFCLRFRPYSKQFLYFSDNIFQCFKADEQLVKLASSKRSKSRRERKKRKLKRSKSRRRRREDSSSEEDTSSPEVESDSNSDSPRGQKRKRRNRNNKHRRSKSDDRSKKRRKSSREKKDNNKDEDLKDKPKQNTAQRGHQEGKLSEGLLHLDTSPMSSLKTGDNKLSSTFTASKPVKEEEYAHIVYRPDTNSVAISRSLKELLPANTTVVYKVDETSNANEVDGLMRSIKRRFNHDSELSEESPKSADRGNSRRSKYYIVNSNLLLKGDEDEHHQKVKTTKTAPLKMNNTMFVYSTKTTFAKWPGLDATLQPSLLSNLHNSIHHHQQPPEGESDFSKVKRKRKLDEMDSKEEVENEDSSDDEIEDEVKEGRRRRHGRQLVCRKHNKHHRLKRGHRA